MSTLGVSVRQRASSRISFYLLLAMVLWTTNLFLPETGAWENASWEERGVAQPLIGVPLSEVPSLTSLPVSR